MKEPDYNIIYKHYEKQLELHGANHLGMDWPNNDDLIKRFKAMFNLIRNENLNKISLLDLGCGVCLFYDFLKENNLIDSVNYSGVDISEKMISKAKELHPDLKLETRDILLNPLNNESFDYIIMNGVLTEKKSLTQKAMESFAQNIISAAYSSCKKGIAFNVMSTHVDWTREDLFHWELDKAIDFLVKNCSRNIVINMDYGLYEYTVYLYKKPNI